jgi:hypothetical protein
VGKDIEDLDTKGGIIKKCDAYKYLESKEQC